VLTHVGYDRETPEERHQKLEQNSVGFGMMLENLEAYVLGRELPYPFGF
jgi:hypothetical protein